MFKNNIGFSTVTLPTHSPELFDAFAQTCVKAAAKLVYYSAIENTIAGRLTKKRLMTAPAGAYLASNCYTRTAAGHEPVFAEVVADTVEDRLQQWSRIKAARADDRLCYLYKSRAAYDQLNDFAELGGLLRR